MLLQADQRLKQNHRDVLLPAHPQELYPLERKCTDVEPEDFAPVDYSASKQLSTLLRHGHLPREDDGALEFSRMKEHLRNDLERSHYWPDEMWKSKMARRRRQQETISILN